MHAEAPAATGSHATEADAIFGHVLVGIDGTPESLVGARPENEPGRSSRSNGSSLGAKSIRMTASPTHGAAGRPAERSGGRSPHGCSHRRPAHAAEARCPAAGVIGR